MTFGRPGAIPVRKLIAAAVAFFSISFGTALYHALARQEAPQLDAQALQPLPFSHRSHAADNEIPCQFCHAYARRGPVAGVPSVQQCVGCHRTVAVDQPDVVRLMEYWENSEPIPWVRVHDLPNYVRFTHKRHVLADVECQTCHGDVQGMDAAVQTSSLTMGWCVTCHEERQAPTDCLACHY